MRDDHLAHQAEFLRMPLCGRPSRDHRDLGIAEQRQAGGEVVGVQLGVGVEDQHDLETVREPELLDSRLQGSRLAPVGLQIEHVRTFGADELHGRVGGAVRGDEDLFGRHESRGGADRGGDHALLVVGRHEDGDPLELRHRHPPGDGRVLVRAGRPHHMPEPADRADARPEHGVNSEHQHRQQQIRDDRAHALPIATGSGSVPAACLPTCRDSARRYSAIERTMSSIPVRGWNPTSACASVLSGTRRRMSS